MASRGVKIAFALLSVALVAPIALFFFLYLLIGRAPTVDGNAILSMQLGGDLVEVAPANLVSFVRESHVPTVRTVVDNLRKAKVDTRVNGVFLKLTGLSTPYWGKVQEIRDAMIDFRTSGKPLYAYLEYGGGRDYYLATAADRVFLMPSSPLEFAGIATYEVFLRGALDKAGVYPDLHHIGDYKTAPNTFTEKTFTAAHREMDESLNADLLGQVVRGVAEGRKRSTVEVRALVDQGPFLPEQALKAGLIDEIGYEDEALLRLRAVKAGSAPNTIDGERYAQISLASLGLNRGPRIGVVYATGAIVSGKGGFDPLNGVSLGSETLIDAIRDAARDASLRAIILRIDSPGGSAAASDAIWRELMLVKRDHPEKPLIASMGDLAASGGYYIALPAKAIVAQPSTLTGSIGIFGGKFVTGGLYEKLGANVESSSIGTHAELNSPARPFNKAEGLKVDEQLRAFYDGFLLKVADSRGSTPAKIDQLARGRVWTGQQARGNGLVDELGGLDRAIAVAKERAGLAPQSDVELVTYPTPKTFYELLAETMSGESQAAVSMDRWLRANLTGGEVELLRAVRGPATMFRRGEALALMPYTFTR